jgi:hypothetical protein
MIPHLTHLPPAFLVPPALAAIVGLIGTAIAWRGRRVGSHPTCRRCGYDLRGKPADSSACPECGADLASTRAIRIGQCVTRRGWLTASLAMLLLGTLSLTACGLAAVKGFDWNHQKPQWYLVREARGTDATARDAALGELVSRISDKRMSDAQLVALTDEALAYQADLNKPWVAGWGDALEAARNAGRLPDDKWRRYARQAVVPSITLWARPIVRHGDPLITQIRAAPTRLARAVFFIRWDNEAPDDISGHPTPSYGGWNSNTPWPFASRGNCNITGKMKLTLWSGLNDGPQTVRVPTEIAVYDNSPATGVPTKPMVREQLQLHARWTSVPKDAIPVIMRTDEAAVDSVIAAVLVKSLTESEDGTLTVKLDAIRPPIPLIMTCNVRSGGREWHSLEPFQVQANGVCSAVLRIRSGTLPDVDQFDVVLRPAPKLALRCWDFDEIWGREIVFPGVKVIR